MRLKCALFIGTIFCVTISTVGPTKAPVECRAEFVAEFRGCACANAVAISNNNTGSVGSETTASVQVRCQALGVSALQNLNNIFVNDKQTRPLITAFSATAGRLESVGQDAFRDEPLERLDLSCNAIDSVNVNAFRGLENKLKYLDLHGNEFSAVPQWALTYLRALVYLNLRENGVEFLAPRTFAETQLNNLRYLHMDRNQIRDVPSQVLRSLSSLQVLSLAGNRIEAMGELSMPDSLWFLDLKSNKLTEIPYLALKGLNRLGVLDLENNNITLIAPHASVRLADVVELDLLVASNRIRELEVGAFDSFGAFRRLDLSYNQIRAISGAAFRALKCLRNLDLSYNFVAEIPEQTFVNVADSLEALSLKENRLREAPAALRPLRALHQLNLDNNQLTSLNEALFENFKANLTELSLASNRLNSAPSAVLQGMFQLYSLDLSKNQITRIEKMAFGSFDGSTGSATTSLNLIRLNLAGNRIQEIIDPGAFLYMSSLTHLDLSFNRIKQLTRVAMERLESLESLYLHHNEMVEFPQNALSSLNKLRQLLLDHNQILNLPNYAFQWLVRLERLGLSHNRIHTLNAKTFHSTSANQVRWLNLGFNQISTMHTSAFENLLNIEQLLLNDNRLTSLQPQIISSLQNLRHLTLAHNQINETLEGAFANLPQLESLSMAHNRIRTMKEGIFYNVPNLTRLDLSHNQIEAFDLDFLEESGRGKLALLDLSYNVIRKLDVSSARKSLIRLELQSNQLEYIDGRILRGFERLVHVDLSRNNLIELEAGAFLRSRRLERLVLANNGLRTLWKDTFVDQTFLSLLDLSANTLHTLEVGVFGRNNVAEIRLAHNQFGLVPTRALASIRRSLSVLDLSHNAIRLLEPASFAGLVNVTRLNLAHNRIESLEEEAFREMIQLKYLDISSNPITSWHPRAFADLSPCIEWLNLAETGLFSMPKLKAGNLRELNVSRNRIYELLPSDVEQLPKLAGLDVSWNNLLDLKPAIFSRLRELKLLNLSGNGVRALQPEHFKFLENLNTLHLGNLDALVRIPEPSAFGGLRHIQHFYIYNIPQIGSYPIQAILEHLPPLKSAHFELKAEHIPQTLFKHVDTRLLRRLTISGSRIKSIDVAAFQQIRGFQIDLTIRDTSLVEFPAEILQAMNGVSFLYLALVNNSIQTLNLFASGVPPPALNSQGTILESIDLRNNPIVCDCRLRWLSDWIDYHIADNSAKWQNAKALLDQATCHPNHIDDLSTRTLKRPIVTLLDAYERSRLIAPSTRAAGAHVGASIDAGGALDGGNLRVGAMHCDGAGHLIAGAKATSQFDRRELTLLAIVAFILVRPIDLIRYILDRTTQYDY